MRLHRAALLQAGPIFKVGAGGCSVFRRAPGAGRSEGLLAPHAFGRAPSPGSSPGSSPGCSPVPTPAGAHTVPFCRHPGKNCDFCGGSKQTLGQQIPDPVASIDEAAWRCYALRHPDIMTDYCGGAHGSVYAECRSPPLRGSSGDSLLRAARRGRMKLPVAAMRAGDCFCWLIFVRRGRRATAGRRIPHAPACATRQGPSRPIFVQLGKVDNCQWPSIKKQYEQSGRVQAPASADASHVCGEREGRWRSFGFVARAPVSLTRSIRETPKVE